LVTSLLRCPAGIELVSQRLERRDFDEVTAVLQLA
jgi:hypothetical protein